MTSNAMRWATPFVLTASLLTGCAVIPNPVGEIELSGLNGDRLVQVDAAQEPVSGAIDLYEAMARALKYNLDHHIVSHGDPGEIRLGNTVLNAASVGGEHADELATIGAALSESGDILVYGCDVAAGEEGAAFVAAFAEVTGADIAASTDDTGHADLGGDWDLEARSGLIEAAALDAPEWNGLMAPLTITVSNQPTTNGLTGVGAEGLWTNAGSVGGTSIDIRATVVSADAGATVQFATAFGANAYGPGRDADDMWLQITNGNVTVRWEIFASGTNQTIQAFGDPNFRISDIDGNPFATLPFPQVEVEAVAPSLNGLTQYTTETVTNLDVGVNNGELLVRGTEDQGSESTSLVAFDWANVSSWEVSYTAVPGMGTRFFFHDGDGDFTFVSPNTTALLGPDLDGNNSTASGTAYQGTFVENGGGVPVLDTDTTITQHAALGANLGSASLVLTNPQAGDQILVNGSTAASGTVNGLNYTISNTGGTITASLSGDASVADYEAALKTITFNNTLDNPDTANRQIAVNVTNTNFGTTSATAISTILIDPRNDAPVAQNDTEATDQDSILSDSVLPDNGNGPDADIDGDTLTVSAVNGAGFTSGQAITLPSGALLTMNGNGSYSYDPNGQFDGLALGATDTDGFTYTVSDGNGGTDTATVSITITGTNDAPIPVDPNNPNTPPADPNNYIPAQVGSDGSAVAAFDLTPYFTDPDTGDSLTLAIAPAELPPGLVFNPLNNQITGTPTSSASQGGPNNDGVYPITVTVTDNNGAQFTTTLTYTISNPPPVAVNDVASASEDGPAATGNVITDAVTGDADTSPDSDPLTVTAANQGGNALTLGQPFMTSGGGSLTLNGDGSYSFDPGTAYNGLDAGETATETITYTIDDGNGGTDTATLTITIIGANDAPVVVDPANPGPDPANPVPGNPAAVIPTQAVTDGQDYSTAPLVDVATAVVDPDGEPLTFTTTNMLPAGLTLNPDGTITGTIGPNASQGGPNSDGVYPVTVTATDPDGATTTLTFTIDVSNPPPVAVNDFASASEDGPAATGNVITDAVTGDADTAPDSDPLTVTAANQGGNALTLGQPFTTSGGGSLTLNGDGSYSFDPGTAYNGLDVGETATETITYTVDDGNGGTDTATLTITINGANDAPVVVDPANPGPDPTNPVPGNPATVIPTQAVTDGQDYSAAPLDDVATAVVDPDGEPLTFTTTNALPAGLTLNPDGTITGTIGPNASQGGPNNDGLYPVTVTATDPDGATTTLTFTIDVSNPPPVAVNDTATASEDGPAATGNVITDAVTGDADTAPDSDPLTVTAANQGGIAVTLGQPFTTSGGGSLTLNGDGSYSFDPGTAYNGLDVGKTATETITYTVDDGNGGTDTATLTITINGANDAPVVIDPANPGPDPANPVPGNPATVIPTQAVTDGQDYSAAPLVDVATAVVDPDGEPLTFTTTNMLPAGLTLNPDGTITGTIGPNASQGGPNNDGLYPITVTATDPDGATTTLTFSIDVSNPPPVAVNDTASASEDGPAATGNVITDAVTGDADTAPDSDPLTVTAANQGGNALTLGQPFTTSGGGSLTLNGDGSYSFDPGTAYNGLDVGETATETITYTVDDGNGGTDTATLTITINGANDAPVVVDPANPGPDPANPVPAPDPLNIIPDVAATDGTPLTPIQVSNFVVDPDDEPLTYTLDPASTPAWLAILPGTGELTGTPPADASQNSNTGTPGEYLVSITATDPDGASVVTTVTVTVANEPVLAVDDTSSASEDDAQSGNLITDPVTGDTDTGLDTDPLRVTQVDGQPVTAGGPLEIPLTHGTLQVSADGTWNFTPNDTANALPVGDVQTETVTYEITDDNGSTATATLSVDIVGTNDAPLPEPDTAKVKQTESVKIDVLGNDIDPDTGDTLNVIAAFSGQGAVAIGPNGDLSFTPRPDFVGTATITYVVSDGNGGTATSTVTVTVEPVDLSPKISTLIDPPASELPSPPESLRVEGAVLAAVNGVLNSGTQGQFGAGAMSIGGTDLSRSPIQAIANQFSSLNGLPSLHRLFSLQGTPVVNGPDGAVDTVVDHIDASRQVYEVAHDNGDGNGRVLGPDGIGGFSLRYGRIGDVDEAITLESLTKDGVLILQVGPTIGHGGPDVVGYRFEQADGRPAPAWLEAIGPSMRMGEPPADRDTLELRVTAILEDGTELSRDVTIQTPTGEIQPKGGWQESGGAPLFTDQLDVPPVLQADEVETLGRALAR